jgi:hypothetical protein
MSTLPRLPLIRMTKEDRERKKKEEIEKKKREEEEEIEKSIQMVEKEREKRIQKEREKRIQEGEMEIQEEEETVEYSHHGKILLSPPLYNILFVNLIQDKLSESPFNKRKEILEMCNFSHTGKNIREAVEYYYKLLPKTEDSLVSFCMALYRVPDIYFHAYHDYTSSQKYMESYYAMIKEMDALTEQGNEVGAE